MYPEDNDAFFIMLSLTKVYHGCFNCYSLFSFCCPGLLCFMYLCAYIYFFVVEYIVRCWFLSSSTHCEKSFRLLDVATFCRDNRNSIRCAHLSFICVCLLYLHFPLFWHCFSLYIGWRSFVFTCPHRHRGFCKQ